jgi:hypothetical protein
MDYMYGEGQYYELVSGPPVPESPPVMLLTPIEELSPRDEVASI